MKLEIRINDSSSSAEYKAQLNALMLDTFGFSFEAWHGQGLWNDDYTCYSIIEDGVMLANASVYKLRMLVIGEEKEVFQIGAVATLKAYRGQGLSRKIIDFILELYPDQPFLLFANQGVKDFYPKFGFRRVYDMQPNIPFSLDHSSGKLKRLASRDPKVKDYLYSRSCFSRVLDCKNAAPINWFNLQLEYSDCIYEIPDLHMLLVARQVGSTLTLYDVAAESPFLFEDLEIGRAHV
jgi:GNAT superfamily N-acetyltransferase